MIRIVTDSTCDLPAELVAQYGITIVPINIQFGQESYQEGLTLDGDAFYRRVEALHMIPTTSQPSLGQFQAAYRGLAAGHDTEAILSIHITSHLSGTYSAASVAAGQMPQQPPIAVFDSLSGSLGLGFMVLEAARLAQAGAKLPEIMARLEEVCARMRIYFCLEDLRFARMSGRVGVARALLVTALNIKLLLTVQGGRLALFKRVRSRPRALETLLDALAGDLGHEPAKVGVIHAQAPDVAEELRRAVMERLPHSDVMVHELSIGIAVHFGPGTVGLVGYHL